MEKKVFVFKTGEKLDDILNEIDAWIGAGAFEIDSVEGKDSSSLVTKKELVVQVEVRVQK